MNQIKLKLKPVKNWVRNYRTHPFGEMNVSKTPHSLKPQKPDVFDEEFNLEEKKVPAPSSVSLSYDPNKFIPVGDSVHYVSIMRESKVIPSIDEIKKYANNNDMFIVEQIHDNLWDAYLLGQIRTKREAINYILNFLGGYTNE